MKIPIAVFAMLALSAVAEETPLIRAPKMSDPEPRETQFVFQASPPDPQPLTFNFSFPVGKLIPDNDPSGLVDVRNIVGVGYITEILVTMEISGGANGDYYVYLQHDNEIAVLLNRVGKSDTLPGGYNDPGLNVTFSDAAAQGDIHIYRVTLFGNENTPLGAPLDSHLGDSLWQPDGRNVSPFAVTTGSPRNAQLSAFHNHLLNGGWTLFAADVNPSQMGVLVGWNMQVTVIPEPGTVSLLGIGIALLWRHHRNRTLG